MGCRCVACAGHALEDRPNVGGRLSIGVLIGSAPPLAFRPPWLHNLILLQIVSECSDALARPARVSILQSARDGSGVEHGGATGQLARTVGCLGVCEEVVVERVVADVVGEMIRVDPALAGVEHLRKKPLAVDTDQTTEGVILERAGTAPSRVPQESSLPWPRYGAST